MVLAFSGMYRFVPRELMRRAGYAEFIDPRTRETSYVRRLRPGMLYPRFHAYVESAEGGFRVNLHLDQKQASYRGTNKHAGEYDGPVVEQEGARIEQTLRQFRM